MRTYIDPDATPSEKALRFFALLLFNNRAYSLKELTSLLSMSKPAISRMIVNFENAWIGNLKREKRGREIYVRLDRTNVTGKLSINADGLEQLFLCRELLANILPENMRDTMATTLSQAAAFLPADQHSLKPVPACSLPKGKIDYSPYQSLLATLLEAIKTGKICKIEYAAQINEPTKSYFFAPKRLVSYNDCLYLDGWKVTEGPLPELIYDDPLRLPLQRFKSCEITKASSAHLPETPEQTEAFGFMQWEEFEIRARFWNKAAVYVAERQWSANQKVEWDESDNSIILTATMANAPETIAWLLSFGDTVKLLEPAWLVRELKKILISIKNLYKQK